jgi:hypothetical protein
MEGALLRHRDLTAWKEYGRQQRKSSGLLMVTQHRCVIHKVSSKPCYAESIGLACQAEHKNNKAAVLPATEPNTLK